MTMKTLNRSPTEPAMVLCQVERIVSPPVFLLLAGKRRRLVLNMRELCLVPFGLQHEFVLHLPHRVEHRLVYILRKAQVLTVMTKKFLTVLTILSAT